MTFYTGYTPNLRLTQCPFSQITPPRRASKSPGTPDTVTMAMPETVSMATPETVAMATPAAPPAEMPPPTPADTESGQERVDNVLSDLSELQVRRDDGRIDTLVRTGCRFISS